MNSFRPVGNKILVRPISTPKTSLISLPDGWNNEDNTGIVEKLGTYNLKSINGTYRRTQEWPVEVGQTIMYNGDADVAKVIEINGETFHVIAIGHVLAVIENEK